MKRTHTRVTIGHRCGTWQTPIDVRGVGSPDREVYQFARRCVGSSRPSLSGDFVGQIVRLADKYVCAVYAMIVGDDGASLRCERTDRFVCSTAGSGDIDAVAFVRSRLRLYGAAFPPGGLDGTTYLRIAREVGFDERPTSNLERFAALVASAVSPTDAARAIREEEVPS